MPSIFDTDWGSISGPGAIFSAFGFGGDEASGAIYGKKPVLPTPPSPDQILSDASLANLGSLDAITKLGTGVNQANLDWNLKAFEEAAPGTGAARQQYLRNITDNLAGVVSPDVVDRLKRQGAAWKIGSGTGGAPIGDLRDLRNYGVASMARQDLGGQQLESLLENIRKYTIPKPFDYSQSFLHPSYDPYGLYKSDVQKAIVEAAPEPAAAGTAAAQIALLNSILGMFGGGGGGGGSGYEYPYYADMTPATRGGYSGSGTTGGWGDSMGYPAQSAWA